MKAKVTVIIRHNDEYYRLTTGKEVPSMPDELIRELIERGYIEAEDKKPNLQKLEGGKK